MADKYYGGARSGLVDYSIPVRLVDTTTNLGKTGVAAGSVTAFYYRQGASASTSITVSALTNLGDAHSDGGWKEVDATNMPGLYRFDVPDAVFAAGVDFAVVGIKVSGAYEFQREYPIETRRSLRRGIAYNNFHFYLQDAAGNGITSGTPTCERLIDGGTFAAMTNSATHVANGVWKINLSATDLGSAGSDPFVTFKFSVTGAVTRVITIPVEP